MGEENMKNIVDLLSAHRALILAGVVSLITSLVTALIAGVSGAVTSVANKAAEHWFDQMLVAPHMGGELVNGVPKQVCQVVRFWVPSKLPQREGGGMIPEVVINDLHAAILKGFGGWTTWPVHGQWKDPRTEFISTEDGQLYEVGMDQDHCKDEDVKNLYDTVDHYVGGQMKQTALYFSATRFTQPR
jgi:hypothetical protein